MGKETFWRRLSCDTMLSFTMTSAAAQFRARTCPRALRCAETPCLPRDLAFRTMSRCTDAVWYANQVISRRFTLRYASACRNCIGERACPGFSVSAGTHGETKGRQATRSQRDVIDSSTSISRLRTDVGRVSRRPSIERAGAYSVMT